MKPHFAEDETFPEADYLMASGFPGRMFCAVGRPERCPTFTLSKNAGHPRTERWKCYVEVV